MQLMGLPHPSYYYCPSRDELPSYRVAACSLIVAHGTVSALGSTVVWYASWLALGFWCLEPALGLWSRGGGIEGFGFKAESSGGSQELRGAGILGVFQNVSGSPGFRFCLGFEAAEEEKFALNRSPLVPSCPRSEAVGWEDWSFVLLSDF